MKYKGLSAGAIAVLGICAVYANSFHNGFHFDDFHTVVNNPAIRSLSHIPRFFTDATTFSILPANQTYRPIVSTTLALDYWMGHGLHPFYFHIGTFLIYLMQCVVMMLLFRKVLESACPERNLTMPAIFAAAWYGLHPAMAETVNYVIQRGDVYDACGVVCALLLYAARPRWRRWGVYLLPYVLALLSKPPAIVFPALLFAYLAMFEAPPERRYRYAVMRTWPSVLTGAVVMAWEATMTPKSFTPSTLSSYAWFITQPYVLLREFVTFFLPLHLNVDTDLKAFSTVNADAVFGFLFLAALLAAIVLLSRAKALRPVAFGLLWFLAGALPTALYKLSEVENDHRLFLPFVGLALAATSAAWLAVERLARKVSGPWIWRAVTASALLLLCAYGWAAHIRNRVWHSEASLWYDDALKSPHNGRGLMNYGLVLMSEGKDEAALHYFDKAKRYTPDYPTLEINLGIVNGLLADQGRPQLETVAERYFLRAIALAPGDDLPHAYYGRWLLDHGRVADAVRQLQLAVTLNPAAMMQRDLLIEAEERTGDLVAARQQAQQALRLLPTDTIAKDALQPQRKDASYWINQSLNEYQQQQFLLAIASARRALALAPHSALAYNNIGASYGALKEWKPAIESEKAALRYDPQLAIARNNLALFLQKKTPAGPGEDAVLANHWVDVSLHDYEAGDYEGCLEAARTALRWNPRSPEAWNNMAAANAALHRWPAAARAAQQALALKPDFTLARNNLAWAQSHLQAHK
ncbi:MULTISPECIES: tetratricopeptide repeat protein [Acidobacterium]|uniref:TPR domain protein n=1 Tax=Acidobacterium capsulatum (strain ATCC 51196 / DSM 11244 / BCRC 80197 / JCM 7670 / NBRC 15755 / NCIMB 13165 / 161) TaxID=240015 RepID=C1F4Q2_ACIC5|nr:MULTISPECIES: tetratricopeptide repeat protein [Acidobacterium]ACO33149.1 TPR domain protein [Acidobacterium capsulatum ATCC 51196]HCT59466.1 hypothetical protein [Acidobacterium sp.]